MIETFPQTQAEDMRIANAFATGEWMISGVNVDTNRVQLQATFARMSESLPVPMAVSIVSAGPFVPAASAPAS